MNDQKEPEPTFRVLILAGGRSARMGTDKASLPYGALTLLEHMRVIASRAGAAAVRVGGGTLGDLPDPIAGAGPVAGLWALARAARGESPPSRWVAIPVDMPRVEPSLLRRLAFAGPSATCFAGHPLPLALTLDTPARNVLERVGERLTAGESVSVRSVLGFLGAVTLSPDAGEREQLVNANTPQEWERLVAKGFT